MKKVLILLSLANFAFSQSSLFEPNYSAVAVSYSKTLKNYPINGLNLSIHKPNNYEIELNLNFVRDRVRSSENNSVGLGINRFFHDSDIENRMPVSGYTHFGIEFINVREFFMNLNLGFALFRKFDFNRLALIPEFNIMYYFMLGSREYYAYWGPDYFLITKNTFLFGLKLHNTFNITEKTALILTPGMVFTERNNTLKLEAGFSFGL